MIWKPGDRVEHGTFGTGTVIEANDQHTVVHFDAQGRKKFASSRVELSEAQPIPPAPTSRRTRSASERTTDVGYENLNQQTVVRAADLQGSPSGGMVYVLKCLRCGVEYGTSGSDILLRRCPACMDGQPGLAI